MLNAKRFVSAVLTGVLLVSACGCSFSSNQKKIDEINSVADTFAKSACYLDGKSLLSTVEEIDSSKADEFTKKLSMEDLSYDESVVKLAIAETMSYTVKTETAQVEKKEGSVDVVFTIDDYEEAFKDLVGYSDVFVSAVKARKSVKQYTVHLNLHKGDEGWLITEDSLAGLGELYSFLDYEMYFCADTKDLYDSSMWMFTEDDTYINTDVIELDVWFKAEPEEKLYYTVGKDGEVIYSSTPTTCGTHFSAIFDVDYRGATRTDDYLSEGIYTIKVFAVRKTDALIASATATVSISDEANPDVPMQTSYYTVEDSSFASIADLGWWDYNSTMIADDTYCADTKTLGFSIQINGNGPELYYAYYYLGENEGSGTPDLENPVYDTQIVVQKYKDGTVYYNMDYDPSELKPGTYVIYVAADENSLETPYITATCTVITQTSAEF